MSNEVSMHATTIVTVRKGGKVVIAGDGQVSLGQTIMKGNARKVRRIGKDGHVIAGFAGQPSHLARVGLDDGLAQADLPVAGDHNLRALAHRQDGGAMPRFACLGMHV